MRLVLALITGVCLLASATANTTAGKNERRSQKQAQKEYLKAIESIRAGAVEKGGSLLDEALRLDPTNPGALTARELLRQRDVQQKVTDANQALAANQREKAIEGFRSALAIDSGNAAAQEGLRSALAERETLIGA